MSSRLTDRIAIPLLRAGSAASGNSRSKLQDDVAVLFDRFREPLLRYLWSFGLAIPDSEEVLQDVFVSLFRHLDAGRPLDNVRGWLFRVAHNLALKRRGRMRRDTEVRAEPGAEELAIDPAPSPEDRVADTQTRVHLMAVVEALPEQDRRCLFLRAEGLRYREIAEILDMSIGAISLSLARSLARLTRSAGSRNPDRRTRDIQERSHP